MHGPNNNLCIVSIKISKDETSEEAVMTDEEDETTVSRLVI